MKAIRLLASTCMVVAEPEQIPIKARKVQALLAFLALNRAAHSREALATLLWGDRDDVHARHSLNQCVHELRQTIEDTTQSVICSDGDDLRLDRRTINVDVGEFEAAVAEGSRSSLMRAPEIYSHDLLTGLKIRSDAFDAWLNTERRRLRDLACGALQRLANMQAADGNLDGACASASRAVALDPGCESAHRGLMRIYADRGDHAAAERQYRSCHEVLDREFSLGPEIETERLHETIQGMRHGMAVKSSATLSGQPCVAVNPFVAIGGEADSLHFARGLTGDVATALHRWSGIGVVLPTRPPESTSHAPEYCGGSVANQPCCHARYAVDGTVRKSGSRVRVTVQLVDTLTSSQVWADRYDRGVDDILAVQDEITNRVAGAVEPELLRHEAELSQREGIDENDPYDLFRLGSWHLQRFNPADNAKAIQLLRRSARLDPGLLQASVGLARALLTEWSYGWGADALKGQDELLVVLEHVFELDHGDPYCHYLTAATNLLGRHHEVALAAAASAVELNPYFALGHFVLGQASLMAGCPEAAIEAVNTGLRLDPRNVELPRWLTVLSCAKYQLRQYDQAALLALAAIQRRVAASSYLILAAAYGQLGRVADASTAFSRFQRISAQRLAPAERPAFARFSDLRHIIHGLARAGIRSTSAKAALGGSRAEPVWRVASAPPVGAADGRQVVLARQSAR